MGSQPIRKVARGNCSGKWFRGQNYAKKESDSWKSSIGTTGLMESATNQKVARESAQEIDRKIDAWEIVRDFAGESAQESARDFAQESASGNGRRGQNYLRKTVIGGNVAFRMG